MLTLRCCITCTTYCLRNGGRPFWKLWIALVVLKFCFSTRFVLKSCSWRSTSNGWWPRVIFDGLVDLSLHVMKLWKPIVSFQRPLLHTAGLLQYSFPLAVRLWRSRSFQRFNLPRVLAPPLLSIVLMLWKVIASFQRPHLHRGGLMFPVLSFTFWGQPSASLLRLSTTFNIYNRIQQRSH